MKVLKKTILVIAILFAVIFANGVYYVLCGQQKSVEKLNRGEELNLYECCSIYSMHVAAAAFSWTFCPEASDQCLAMMFHKDGGTYIRTKNRKTLVNNSSVIRDAVNSGKNKCVINFPLNNITGNKNSSLRKELRYACAYDGAFYVRTDAKSDGAGIVFSNPTTAGFYESIELKVKYDKYVGDYHLGNIHIKFYWALLNYIQSKGLIHECTFIYRLV